MLPVACISLAMTNVADLVDMTIAGRILGETALGAIELIWPVVEFVFFIGTTIASGTAIRYSSTVGMFEGKRAARWFSNGLILSALVGGVLALGMLVLREWFLGFYEIGSETLLFVRPYWNFFMLQALLSPINIYLVTLVCADGDTRSCTVAFVSEFVVNVVSTWFLCHSYGTAGCAIGTALGTASGIVMVLPHFFRKANSLKFVPYFSVMDSFVAFNADLPSSSAVFFTAVLYVFMNKLLVSGIGDSALVVMAVISISNNFMMFLYGVANAAQPVVGIYYGESNYPAIRTVMRDAVKFELGMGAVLTVLLMAFPSFPAWILGVATPEIMELSVTAVRITASTYFLAVTGSLFITYYLFIELPLPSIILNVLQEAVFPLVGVCAGYFLAGFVGFFVGYALAPVLALATFFFFLYFKHRESFDPFLLPAEKPGQVTNWSFVVNDKAACSIAMEIHARLETANAPMKSVVKADMLVEDTLMTIYDRNRGVRVVAEVTLDMRHGIRIVFRDDGVISDNIVDDGDDWVRARSLGAVVRTMSHRENAKAIGFNRSSYTI